mmetsp:Transcript_6922/g.9183  ORF Transcript_6922/g.9183 Transcript_6922/m.9183 type:complete len:206 (-) Transcript_6922:127-744(-)
MLRMGWRLTSSEDGALLGTFQLLRHVRSSRAPPPPSSMCPSLSASAASWLSLSSRPADRTLASLPCSATWPYPRALSVRSARHPSRPSVTPLHRTAESEPSPRGEFSVAPAAALVLGLSRTHQRTRCRIGCTSIPVSLAPPMRRMDGLPARARTCASQSRQTTPTAPALPPSQRSTLLCKLWSRSRIHRSPLCTCVCGGMTTGSF